MSRITRTHANGFLFALSLWLAVLLSTAWGATVSCGPGDTACLMAAITTANASGEATTIPLAAGSYMLTTGLPVITGTIVIQGAGAALTTIASATPPGGSPAFRLVEVASMGSLTLTGLTLTNGTPAIRNRGTLTVSQAIIRDNVASTSTLGSGGISTLAGTVLIADSLVLHNIAQVGGGGLDVTGGVVTVTRSTFRGNVSQGGGGAIENGTFASAGEVHIQNSAIYENLSETGAGAIVNWSTMTITNTTIASNVPIGPFVDALGISNVAGVLHVLNSTITGHTSPFTLHPHTAVHNADGVVTLENTILSLNSEGTHPGGNCEGVITSLGGNIIGDLTGCTLVLHPDDRTTDPLLDNLVDTGIPGQAYWPLIVGSPAMNAAHTAGCPTTDQLGKARVGRCDSGAVEFQPPGQRVARRPRR
jgi:hypothetical protein